METIDIPFNAGETKELAMAGEYFEIIKAADPLNVYLYSQTGAKSSAQGAEAGSFLRIGFTSVQIKSDTTQTVKVLIAEKEGGTRRLAGSVEIAGTPQVQIVAQPAYDPDTLMTYQQWAARNGKLFTMADTMWFPALVGGNTKVQAALINPAGSGKDLILMKGARVVTSEQTSFPLIYLQKLSAYTMGTQLAFSMQDPSAAPAVAKGICIKGDGIAALGTVTATSSKMIQSVKVTGGVNYAETEVDIVVKPGFAILFEANATADSKAVLVQAPFIELP